VPGPIRRTDPTRSAVNGMTRLPPSNPARSPVGNQSRRLPLGSRNTVQAMTVACWSVALALAGVAAALWLTWRLVTRWTTVRNCERWSRQWAEVEPLWSGRKPRRPDGSLG
jgi:hypothetical protein